MSGPLDVLVTSDTHVPDGAKLPAALLQLAERADHVLHCGDLTGADVLDVIGAFAPVDAVAGNCDGGEVSARAPHERIVDLGGVRIGMIHDPGPVDGRHQRLAARFPGAAVIIYGHTHAPEDVIVEGGVRILNPGSPVQRRRAPFHSAMWMRIVEGDVESVQLIDLDGT